ncbi:transglycosylase domain-containing protein, partial [Vibrio metoecus]
IAHRRPSYYLAVQGRADLATLTDSHLRLFYREKMISQSLMNAALNANLQFRDFVRQPALVRINTNKGLLAARTHLSRQLGVSLYDLDRMDLSASTTLNFELQNEVTRYLQKLANPEFAAEM